MATAVLDDIVEAVDRLSSATRGLARRPIHGMAQAALWHAQCAKELAAQVETDITNGRGSVVSQKEG